MVAFRAKRNPDALQGQFICRGDVTNLQKRAGECSMIVCPGLTKTRLWKDQPWNSETPDRRWRQIWCLSCKRSSQVSVYGREDVKTTPSNDPFSRCKCAIIGYRKELTITEYSLTTRTKVNDKIQKERNLYLVLRLRGETEHDTNDNVTTKTQNTLNMNTDT